jgi:hypothetical protein
MTLVGSLDLLEFLLRHQLFLFFRYVAHAPAAFLKTKKKPKSRKTNLLMKRKMSIKNKTLTKTKSPSISEKNKTQPTNKNQWPSN